MRVVFSREDVVRLGPKRPPIAARAAYHDGTVAIVGAVAGAIDPFVAPIEWAYRIEESCARTSARVPGPTTSSALRGVGLAERVVLVEGALDAAGVDRHALVRDGRVACTLLDTCVPSPAGTNAPRALAGVWVDIDDDGSITRVVVRIAAGDPLDDVVLRSYAVGAAHMALGWVLNEALTVDPETGEIHDLTIRSFGVVRGRTRLVSKSRSSRTTALRSRGRRMRCSRRWLRPCGMLSRAPTACAPTRSPRRMRARRPSTTPLTSPRPGAPGTVNSKWSECKDSVR